MSQTLYDNLSEKDKKTLDETQVMPDVNRADVDADEDMVRKTARLSDSL